MATVAIDLPRRDAMVKASCLATLAAATLFAAWHGLGLRAQLTATSAPWTRVLPAVAQRHTSATPGAIRPDAPATKTDPGAAVESAASTDHFVAEPDVQRPGPAQAQHPETDGPTVGQPPSTASAPATADGSGVGQLHSARGPMRARDPDAASTRGKELLPALADPATGPTSVAAAPPESMPAPAPSAAQSASAVADAGPPPLAVQSPAPIEHANAPADLTARELPATASESAAVQGTAVPPDEDRLFGCQLRRVPLAGDERPFEPAAYRRCRAWLSLDAHQPAWS